MAAMPGRPAQISVAFDDNDPIHAASTQFDSGRDTSRAAPHDNDVHQSAHL
jgi:hypothetical protein